MFDKQRHNATRLTPHERTAVNLGERLFKILMIVWQRPPGQKINRGMLALACECDTRTIGRAISILRSEYDLEWDKGEKTYKLPPGGHPLATVPLTFEEVIALVSAGPILRSPQFPQHEIATNALNKVVSSLSPVLRSIAEAALQSAPPAVLPRDYGHVLLPPLIQAVQNKQTLKMDYGSYSSGRSWRDIDPYAVTPRDGIYYELHGWCHNNKALRTFALDRVHAVEPQNNFFVRDETAWTQFSSHRGIGGIRGDSTTRLDVDVQFSAKVATYARNQSWPESLHLHDSEAVPGAVCLRGWIADGATRDALLNELLRWRRHVIIVGGTKLRQAYRDEIQTMLDQHSEKIPDSSD